MQSYPPPLSNRYAHISQMHISPFSLAPRAFDLLATDPNIDATLVYDNRGEHAGWKGRLRLIKTLRRDKFDLVVNLARQSHSTVYWCGTLGNGSR